MANLRRKARHSPEAALVAPCVRLVADVKVPPHTPPAREAQPAGERLQLALIHQVREGAQGVRDGRRGELTPHTHVGARGSVTGSSIRGGGGVVTTSVVAPRARRPAKRRRARPAPPAARPITDAPPPRVCRNPGAGCQVEEQRCRRHRVASMAAHARAGTTCTRNTTGGHTAKRGGVCRGPWANHSRHGDAAGGAAFVLSTRGCLGQRSGRTGRVRRGHAWIRGSDDLAVFVVVLACRTPRQGAGVDSMIGPYCIFP